MVGIPPITGYEFRFKANGSSYGAIRDEPSPSTLTIVVSSSIDPGRGYTFQVRSVNHEGISSDWINSQGATPGWTQATTTTLSQPSINLLNTIADVHENTTTVDNFNTSDADGDTVTVTLDGTDKDLFNLVTSGNSHTISFKLPPDYETPPLGRTTYNFTVVATSGTGVAEGTVSQSVTVNPAQRRRPTHRQGHHQW